VAPTPNSTHHTSATHRTVAASSATTLKIAPPVRLRARAGRVVRHRP
jgi:hypothetical protein